MMRTSYLDVAKRIAREAGAILREGYGRALEISYKGAIDLVTDYDRRSEAMILSALRSSYPNHAIHAEESGRAAGDDYEWLVDPPDGTSNFAHAFPIFAVSLALSYQRQPVIGVVYDPLRDELFAAEAGQGATLNGAPIRVSATASLDRALLNTGFPYDVRSNPRNNLDEFGHFLLLAQAVRRAGSAALDSAWVGVGRADGYWEFGSMASDVGAGALIAREAGGRATKSPIPVSPARIPE